MEIRRTYINIGAFFVIILRLIPIAFSNDESLIPPNIEQVESWFQQNVQPLSARMGTVDQALEAAESNVTYIKMRSDGSGDFQTINQAIKSIPTNNTRRVVIMLGGGTYTEKVTIDYLRQFITLYGDPNNMPTLAYHGTAKEYGTVYSATLMVDGDYFTAANLKIANTAPRPNGIIVGAQALALRVGGDKSSIYNCKLYGYQDTLCDDKGRHLYKDCYIEGTVDFIFGGAKSLYLNTELHVVPGDKMAVISAPARNGKAQDLGFSFVHCRVTGGTTSGDGDGVAYLGRAWSRYPNVVYAYTEMSDAVHKEGWYNNGNNANNATVSFGEYRNDGPGADMSGRAPFTTKLTDAQVKPYLSLGFILGSSWLLPPPSASA